MPAIPIDVGFNSPQASSANFTLTVTLSSVVTANTTVQLYCTNTSLVMGSGGGAFPTSLVIPSGSDHASVALHTGSPTSDTSVTIAAGQPGTDMSSSANWQASKVLLISSPNTP